MNIRQYILEQSKDFKVYLDMDGVITDFLRAFNNFTGKSPKGIEFWKYIDGNKDFWTNMPWLPGGKLIWAFVRNLNHCILSSPTTDPLCIIGKDEWIAKNLDKDTPRIYSNEKERYATSYSILIDDKEENIQKWNKAGGVGILHKDSATSIQQLKKIIGMI